MWRTSADNTPPRLTASSTLVITQAEGLRELEALHDFVDGAGLGAGRQHQRGFDAGLHLAQQAQAARQFRIARARARGVDHDELAAAQFVEQLGQFGDVENIVRGDAQQAPQHVHLFVRADAHGVGGDHRDAARAMTQHPARRELGEQRGLAGAGGTGEGDDAALLQPAIAGDAHGARDGGEREAARRREIRVRAGILRTSELARSCVMPSCASSLSMAAWMGERRDRSFQASVASCDSSMRRMSFISLASESWPVRPAWSAAVPAPGTGLPAAAAMAGASDSEICEDARRVALQFGWRACRRWRRAARRDSARSCVGAARA